MVVVAVGLFAVGETLYVATYLNKVEDKIEKMKGSIWMTKADWARSWKPWLRGTALGFPFGTVPAGGAEIPTFLSYSLEKKLSKNPQEFGKGAIEGVAGPEAANTPRPRHPGPLRPRRDHRPAALIWRVPAMGPAQGRCVRDPAAADLGLSARMYVGNVRC